VEFLPRLETNGFSGSDADLRAGAGIASDTGLSRTYIENAEPAQLNALALGKGPLEGFEYGVDGSLRLIALKAGALNHLVNDVLFYQGFLRSGERSDSRLILETFSFVVNAPPLP
jgi:hypothetical protein